MLMKTFPLHHSAEALHPQATVCLTCEVRGHALFGVLDESALGSVNTHIASQETLSDQVIYAAGRPGSAVYTIRRGIVRF